MALKLPNKRQQTTEKSSVLEKKNPDPNTGPPLTTGA